jgi:cell division protein FtsW (lipid II flippase)
VFENVAVRRTPWAWLAFTVLIVSAVNAPVVAGEREPTILSVVASTLMFVGLVYQGIAASGAKRTRRGPQIKRPASGR